MTETTTPVLRRELKIGDTVIAKREDSIIRGAVKKSGTALYIDLPGIHALDITLSLASLVERGYTFERVEPSTPTVPGHYLDRDGKTWMFVERNYHAPEKQWIAYDGIAHRAEGLVRIFGPFTKVG